MISSGDLAFRNYLLFRSLPGYARRQWIDAGPRPENIEGQNLPDARRVKAAVKVPVICTGGFQTASVIAAAIKRGDCDAVSAARPLIANNDLVEIFRSGKGQTREAVHLLQQVPRERGGESSRLLRGNAVPFTRRDDRADHVCLQAGIVRPAGERACLAGGVHKRRMTRRMQFAAGLFVLTLTFTVACGTPTTPPLDNIVEHYKYGILGTEGRVGVPYWIFRVLPIVFADKLPNRPGNRLGEDRVSLRNPRSRSPDRHDERERSVRRRSRRPQLRHMPCGHVP